MSDTMEEGVIAQWHKKVGDTVESGELMAEIETDKATMDYESYNDGTVLYLGAAEGEAVQVEGILAIVGEAGEDYKALLNGASSDETAEAPAAEAAPEAPAETVDTSAVNAEIVRMPKMSDTMEEGVISQWHKSVGDSVESGELMADIETDKATMEYESYNDGVVLYLGAKEGEGVKVDDVLAIVGEAGADYELLLKAEAAGGSASQDAPAETPAPAASTAAPAASTPAPAASPAAPIASENGRLKASPLAKKLAADKGIDIRQVTGTGDGGRIVKKDVENFVPAAAPAKEAAPAKTDAAPAPIALPKVVGEESFEEVRVSQMRKTIAKRLAGSKFQAPHFYLTMEINMDKAIEARKSMNEVSPVKISFNDMVIKAAAAALRQHPAVNSSWLEDKIRINHHIHIGVAVAVDEGLLVPVVRFADNKPLSHISAEVKELGGKAKSKKLQPDEMTGNTFTISNLGMFGIEEFTAIINPPDACIMAVGGIKQTAIVKDGELAIGNIMKVTLSCDHRAVDGAVGSAFLKTFKSLLEEPVRLLV